METVVIITAFVLGIIGIIGSIVPGIPGPPLSWVGLLLLYAWGSGTNAAGDPMSLTFLMIWLVVVIVITVLDYIVPAYLTKVTGGSKYSSWGAIIGLFVGMFITPIGIILGTIAGAFLAELWFSKKGALHSLKAALGAFLGFLCGTGMKLITCGIIMYYLVVYAF